MCVPFYFWLDVESKLWKVFLPIVTVFGSHLKIVRCILAIRRERFGKEQPVTAERKTSIFMLEFTDLSFISCYKKGVELIIGMKP